MAAVLLVLFPLLILFNTRLGIAALVLAIVMLYRGRASTAAQKPSRF